MDFGEIHVNDTATLQTFLSNNGNSISVIDSINFAIGFGGSLEGNEIHPFDSVPLTVMFRPDSVGEFGGALEIWSNSQDVPFGLTLVGSGVEVPDDQEESSENELVTGIEEGRMTLYPNPTSGLLYLNPVSYTHLTLPTIYSV